MKVNLYHTEKLSPGKSKIKEYKENIKSGKDMEPYKYAIKGGDRLEGEVDISGAKNAALGIIAAAIMTEGTCTIDNLPDVSDINAMLDAIQEIGAVVHRVDRHKVQIVGKYIFQNGIRPVDGEKIKKIRASYYLIGSLLGRFKYADVVMPGGCDIGARPIDLHIKGFNCLGAKDSIVNGRNRLEADRLLGTHIYMDKVSVGATINVMLAAALAEGKTTIENAAKEPHIVDVANFLNTMGANIKGAGTDVIRIRGVNSLHGAEYSIIPDQIEAGTFMTLAAVTGGNVLIKNVIPKHLEAITLKLKEMGVMVIEYDDSVRVMADGNLRPTQINTQPYPGFPTDMQAQMAVVLGVARGTSMVTESIFENRFKYVNELVRMGGKFETKGETVYINGVKQYTGADVTAPDLRAGAALVMAALSAEGFSTVSDIDYILRGYEDFDGKIRQLGGKIKIVHNDTEYKKFIFSSGNY